MIERTKPDGSKEPLLRGAHVVYFDEHRVRHDALVTAWWGDKCCNLLFVTDDSDDKRDPYGNQIERRSSNCHRQMNQAGANCWVFPDEDWPEGTPIRPGPT